MAWHGMALLQFGVNFPTDHHRVCVCLVYIVSKLGLHTPRKIFLKVICIGVVHLCSQAGPWISADLLLFHTLTRLCRAAAISLASRHDIKKYTKLI